MTRQEALAQFLEEAAPVLRQGEESFARELENQIGKLAETLKEAFSGLRREVSDGKLMETQTANYFSDIYPIDCAVLSANA